MDGDAVREIAGLERASKRIVTVPCEPSDVYYTVESDGALTRVVAEHVLPEATCFSTKALLEVADREADNGKVVLYYSADKVQAFVRELGGEERNRIHTLPLPLHPVFELLQGHTTTKTYTQRELIRFLRAQLNAYVEESTIEQFRHLNLNTSGEGSSVVDKGRAGVSRSVMQTIRSKESEIPDSITVTAPVYEIDEMLYEPFEVKLLVDCLPDDDGRPVFELTTVHSTLENARNRALEHLAAKLSEGAHPVIYGRV
jgi:hypothetical protein